MPDMSLSIPSNQPTLSQTEIDFFWENGYLVVDDAVSGDMLKALQSQFDQWVLESRAQQSPYGETINGKPRFDLEPGHSKEAPALRRVNAPVEVSDAYY